MIHSNLLQEKTTMFIKKLSKFRCANKSYIVLSKSEKPKKGYVSLSVGEERKKYQVPLKYLSDPIIQQLIKKSQPDVFDAKIDGPLEIACTTNTFDQLLKIFKQY
ncbi:hypothetical protein C1H46_024793 [Malus baccata]|uniref:SAUR family protein n=1 Tax=Malus baccata TaxID=106549 RepID=A0A540LT18_MALBA|nr:hypothetical protein C1H46_024789 [Malus baccata]TQD89658.1 hypothetical protein C1H46_024793 [Malus baccata]